MEGILDGHQLLFHKKIYQAEVPCFKEFLNHSHNIIIVPYHTIGDGPLSSYGWCEN
jgi:hypothetical protein